MRKPIVLLAALFLAAMFAACANAQTPERFVEGLYKGSSLNSLSVSEVHAVMITAGVPGLEVAEGDDIRYVEAGWITGENELDHEIFILRDDGNGGWSIEARYSDAYIEETLREYREGR